MRFLKYFLEKKNWATNVINFRIIAQFIIDAILDGKLTLQSGSNTISVPGFKKPLTIMLKAFNNYKNPEMSDARAIWLPARDEYSPHPSTNLIILYIFAILGTGARYRGLNTASLQRALINTLKMGSTTNIISTISHELQHAWEVDNKIKSMWQDDDKPHISQGKETNARVIEQAAIINDQWIRLLQKGKWLNMYADKHSINRHIRSIINNYDDYRDMPPNIKKRFLKSLYTVLSILWDKYYDWSKKHEYNQRVKSEEIKTIVNTQK